MLSQCVNIVWVLETERQRGNNYVSPFVSAPSIKPEERQPDSMSTYPLKFQQQKDPPPCLSVSPLTLPPTLNALSHNKLLFIALFSKYISSCFGLQQCFLTTPPPPPCISPAALPHLSALRGFNGEPSTPTFLLIIPLPPPYSAAGHRERKKMKRMNILDCTQPEEQ